MSKVKKVLWWIFIAFLIYAVFTQPDRAAEVVRTIWDILVQAVASLGRFFNTLLSR
ncbi:hypothetical protein MM440_01350 [Arsenicicoccus piscis]|uniref:Preprotein translocase subunit SecE n=1 Tax=Arsenicicoccus piscis TaxID=673954 RepID=A0ABQ6HS01_9MICO|nr:hypothetical protein [Arsenicicoccus piscis]MCH8626464.1 hypothetical protein [Arsenicicoccus piscis]GMA21091.1 hypothetical protein GCM10025862_31120 [Arsenicicoccus piscis]